MNYVGKVTVPLERQNLIFFRNETVETRYGVKSTRKDWVGNSGYQTTNLPVEARMSGSEGLKRTETTVSAPQEKVLTGSDLSIRPSSQKTNSNSLLKRTETIHLSQKARLNSPQHVQKVPTDSDPRCRPGHHLLQIGYCSSGDLWTWAEWFSGK